MSKLLYWLSWAVWLAIAVPAFFYSFMLLGEPPFWPSLSGDATLEGISIWAVLAAVFYGLPLYLITMRSRILGCTQ